MLSPRTFEQTAANRREEAKDRLSSALVSQSLEDNPTLRTDRRGLADSLFSINFARAPSLSAEELKKKEDNLTIPLFPSGQADVLEQEREEEGDEMERLPPQHFQTRVGGLSREQVGRLAKQRSRGLDSSNSQERVYPPLQ